MAMAAQAVENGERTSRPHDRARSGGHGAA